MHVRFRTLLVPAVGCLLLSFSQVAGAGSACYLFSWGSEIERVCTQDEGSDNLEFDCRTGRCSYCGVCHAAPSKVRSGFSASQHIAKFPYAMKVGERVRWSDGTAYLTNENGRICIVASGRQLHCFPSTSVVARGPKGEVVGVMTPVAASKTTLAPATQTLPRTGQ